jgi:hypothetical protein
MISLYRVGTLRLNPGLVEGVILGSSSAKRDIAAFMNEAKPHTSCCDFVFELTVGVDSLPSSAYHIHALFSMEGLQLTANR